MSSIYIRVDKLKEYSRNIGCCMGCLIFSISSVGLWRHLTFIVSYLTLLEILCKIYCLFMKGRQILDLLHKFIKCWQCAFGYKPAIFSAISTSYSVLIIGSVNIFKTRVFCKYFFSNVEHANPFDFNIKYYINI